jgi:hypothetical protein
MGAGAAKTPGHPPRDINHVRTRRDLARLINEAADPLLVKQEILDEHVTAVPMEYDNDENFLEFIGPDQDEANHSMEDDEDDEALLDEGDEDDEEGDEHEDGGGGDVVEEEFDDRRGHGSGQEYLAGGDADTEGEGSEFSAAHAAEPAAAAADVPPILAANMAGESNVGIGEPVEAGGGDAGGADGRDGRGDQDGGGELGEEAGEGAGGDAGGISDGDFEEEDLVLEEDGEDELDSKLKPDHRFFAVRALVEGGKMARKLNRRLKVQAGKDDGFLVKGDERYFRNFNDNSIDRRVNVSVSFQYNGTCHTCLNGPHDAWQGRDGQPVVMVAGDHHFPANIPAREDGECIRILRVENGSLAEITGELVRLSPREGAVPGTVIMLGSAVMLGVESVAHYAAEWKKCRNIIKQELGDVIVIPLLHLSPVGIEDRTILRSMIDMAAWYDDLEEVELKLIRNTRLNFMEVNLGRLERGPGWADAHINSRMPVSLSADSRGTTAYVTGDWGKRPERIAPLSVHGERHWLGLLIGEINREMHLGLDTEICLARTLASVRRTKEDVGPIAAVAVGASNAARTATALRRKGVSVTSLGKAGWKISEDAVAYMASELSQRVAQEETLILQCLDSNCFYVLEKNGAMCMPCRGTDGLVHIQGKVVVARGLQLENLLELLSPILRERVGKLTILVCPTVRFLEACCNAHNSMAEADRIAEGERQLRELGSLRREIKTWLVRQGFHDVLLADPLEAAGAAKSVEKARNLMFDAVHMKPAGFAALAGKVREIIQQWMITKKRKGGSIELPAGKRARADQDVGGGKAPTGPRAPRSGAKGARAGKSGSGTGTGRKK